MKIPLGEIWDLGSPLALGPSTVTYIWEREAQLGTLGVFPGKTFSVFLQVGVSAAVDGNMNFQTHSAERNKIFWLRYIILSCFVAKRQ